MTKPEPALPDPVADASGLRTLVAIARAGTVVGAARALGRTQPSVSARLATLESGWGVELFARRPRGMTLTAEGARLLARAEAALAALEDVDRAAGVDAPEGGTLRVGTGDSLGRRWLPDHLRRLVRRRPELEIRVVEGPRGVLLDALARAEIDLAFVAGDRVPERSALRAELQLESPVDLLAPRSAKRPRRALERLRRERCVALHRSSAFRLHVERALAEHSVALHPGVEVGSLSLVRRFVAAGFGVAPVPRVAFPDLRGEAGVSAAPLRDLRPLPYWRVTRTGAGLPAAARAFVELLDG